MSLHLILGPSGSGKTHTLYDTLIRQSSARPDQRFLVLVPEQFTLETQRELTSMHPGHSLTGIDILSFQRLGCRLLEEAGISTAKVLDDTGKNLILRRIADRHRRDFKILGGHLDRMGMIDEIKSFLSELMQYGLKPDDLDRMIGEAQQTTLQWKLEDIRLLYRAFLEEIEGKALTAEGLLTQTGRLAADSGILQGSVIALDGYTGFTPVQTELLAALLRSSRDLYVTVTIGSDETAENGRKNTDSITKSVIDSYTRRGSMSDLFYLSRRTIRQLVRLAEENGTEIADPIFCTGGADYRFADAPQLYHLEQHLFRSHAAEKAAYHDAPGEAAQISVHACTDPREELEFCLQQIRQQVTEHGSRFGDFAIMTGDLSRYENIAPALFAAYEVPYFFDRTRRLDYHPFSQALLSLLQIFSDDFSYSSVFGFLRSGFGPLDEEETDRLENYVLAAGLRGYSAWRKRWKRNPQHLSEEELAQINALRETFLEGIVPLREVFAGHQNDILTQTKALWQYLVSLGTEETLAARAALFRTAKEMVRAREEEQIWTLVMQVMEKMTEVLPEGHTDAAGYAELLSAGFSATTLRVAPPQKDTVLFGDMERTRLNHVKTLFLIGANDGVIPRVSPEGGLLSEFERQSLKDAGEELAYSAREKALLENFYLYQNLTKPSEALRITFAYRGSDGSALRRSSLIASVLKLFPQMQIRETHPAAQMVEAEALLTPEASLEGFARQTGALAETDGTALPGDWKALLSYYMDTEAWRDLTERILQAACAGEDDSSLSPETAQSLYGKTLRGSVTRLELYAGCAFAHFAQYGLALQERQTAGFEMSDMGSLLHDAAGHYSERVRAAGLTLHELTIAQVDAFADAAMDMAMADRSEDAAFDEPVNRQIALRLRRVFHRTAQVVTDQVRAGQFEPAAEEVPFRAVWPLKDGTMLLRGRIDRVDTALIGSEDARQCAVRIIDYKSGEKKLEPAELAAGLSLQLPLYLESVVHDAAGGVLPPEAQETAVAAGMFYYAMMDPVAEEQPDESPQEREMRLRRELRLTGLMNADPAVLAAMDDILPEETSLAVVLKRRKDGMPDAKSQVVSGEELDILMRYARRKAADAGEEILAGEIGIHPYRKGQRTACDYCPYRSVCGFDRRQTRYTYREIGNLNLGDALSQMREALQDGGDA